MEDFVTWVLLRVDPVLANANNNRKDDAQPAPKRNAERVLPFGVLDECDAETTPNSQSAA
jgi:hypothetical protein